MNPKSSAQCDNRPTFLPCAGCRERGREHVTHCYVLTRSHYWEQIRSQLSWELTSSRKAIFPRSPSLWAQRGLLTRPTRARLLASSEVKPALSLWTRDAPRG